MLRICLLQISASVCTIVSSLIQLPYYDDDDDLRHVTRARGIVNSDTFNGLALGLLTCLLRHEIVQVHTNVVSGTHLCLGCFRFFVDFAYLGIKQQVGPVIG